MAIPKEGYFKAQHWEISAPNDLRLSLSFFFASDTIPSASCTIQAIQFAPNREQCRPVVTEADNLPGDTSGKNAYYYRGLAQ